jgi:Protein of unknown function (DUF3631)
MPKKTPAWFFKDIFEQFMAGATEAVRATAEKKMDAWLRRHGRTRADVASLVAQGKADEAEADAAKQPPPSDPRDDASVRFDPKRHNPASLVEGMLKLYVTMPEHALVIYSLAICLTHVYAKFSIAPRVTLVSRKAQSGKSIALEAGARMMFRPNEEAMGTGAAIEEHFVLGPGTLAIDEAQYIDADARRRLQRNQGHVDDRGSKFSKMVKGRKQPISFFGMVFLAGVGKGVGRLLAQQQQSRTLRLEMQRYTKETMPPRNYRIREEVDVEAFNSVYSLVCRWAAKVKLNPKPEMPSELIARDADNFRGLLAVANDCGGEWPRRAREALIILFEQQRAEDPEIVILRHGLVIFDLLEAERVKTTEFDKELRKLDFPEMDWRRYRGLGGDENEHPITARERADLVRESGIKTKMMRPLGGGKPFHGLDRNWFEAALRKREHEPAAAAPHLRLIAPQADEA